MKAKYIYFIVLCILETVKKENNSSGKFIQERPLEIQCEWSKLLNCFNGPPVVELQNTEIIVWLIILVNQIN